MHAVGRGAVASGLRCSQFGSFAGSNPLSLSRRPYIGAGHSGSSAPGQRPRNPLHGLQEPAAQRAQQGRLYVSRQPGAQQVVLDERTSVSVCVRPARSNAELEAAANLRADAYYENTVRGSRFTQNFKKGFASQEYRGLLSRTEAPLGGLPEAVCLVAVSPDSDEVVGTLDLRPPACAGGRHPKGVPKDDSKGAFVLNVVVEESLRGNGIGRALMATATDMAIQQWEAERMYTHVDCHNEGACNLYYNVCGYDVCHDLEWTPAPGKRLLLMREFS